MTKIFYDTETCGLHGFVVLIQYAINSEPVQLYDVWLNPVWKTLELIESFLNADELIGFNLTFDHFQLCKCYTVFSLLNKNWIPIEHISEIVKLEPEGRMGPCLKPKNPLDLMLYSRKGPYQSLMDRKDIRIRKVPEALAEPLATYLESKVKLDDIYFARQKTKSKQWRVYQNKDAGFKDVVLKFAAGGSLKILATFILKKQDVITYDQAELDLYPYELGFAPFADAVRSIAHSKNKSTWDELIVNHVDHWKKELPRKYAKDDVENTRDLYNHFASLNDPNLPAFEAGDNDSVLACMVAATRWRGFNLDFIKLTARRNRMLEIAATADTKPAAVMAALKHVLKPEEQFILISQTGANQGKESTSKIILEQIEKWEHNPAAADTAKIILNARRAKGEVNLINKLLRAKRFHASFNIIGALSSRMSGADGLNPQAIKSDKNFRECFTLADEGYTLCGGDFSAFEVAIAEAVYHDEKLREALEQGKKIHGLFGEELYGLTYEQILATDGTENDLYKQSKSGVFAMIYAGDNNTLVKKLKVDEEAALKAYTNFGKRFPGIGRARQRISDAFCTMKQAVLGGRITWSEPKDSVESLLGFKRFFTLENKICKALFDLSSNLPPEWAKLPIKVVRRERVQTASGAVSSAIYGAAFGIQGAVMRAAANHEIQSTGAQVTKKLQCEIWKHQPHGVNQFVIIAMNIHDEVLACVLKGHEQAVKTTVDDCVQSFKPIIPFIGMKWIIGMQSWASKKG